MVRTELVSPEYFAVLGVPAAGRPAARRRRPRAIADPGGDQRAFVALLAERRTPAIGRSATSTARQPPSWASLGRSGG